MNTAQLRALHIEQTPHNGDTNAAIRMSKVIDAFRAEAIKALEGVDSDDGQEALMALVDGALPAVSAWLGRVQEEGTM